MPDTTTTEAPARPNTVTIEDAGPSRKKLKIERDGKELYTGKDLNRALADRRTIDDAALRDGDRIVIGGRARSMEGFRFAAILVSIAGGLYGLTRAF